MTLTIKIILLVVSAIIGGIVGVLAAKGLARLPKSEQIKTLQRWLLYACTEAEKFYGEKMGVMKLEYVYEKFTKVFPKLAKKIPFDKFSEYVDTALEKMRELIKSNPKFKEYVE